MRTTVQKQLFTALVLLLPFASGPCFSSKPGAPAPTRDVSITVKVSDDITGRTLYSKWNPAELSETITFSSKIYQVSIAFKVKRRQRFPYTPMVLFYPKQGPYSRFFILKPRTQENLVYSLDNRKLTQEEASAVDSTLAKGIIDFAARLYAYFNNVLPHEAKNVFGPTMTINLSDVIVKPVTQEKRESLQKLHDEISYWLSIPVTGYLPFD